ncbi:twin-arginine translocase TatA/TatE family subunit [Altericroceibacterium xinjiangense]|uniref:twin-arginine translocase TatA/TatE family subunit n=1 Tax=Altericroceibacterium xinjiangense TaxID=762261 RepID=UPI000F7DD1DD|nr:twin-arginine translocase TatA/TatE family subunit [Altericroceibacterium xinjiangense]
MNIGPFQILIIALVILVLFGRGRISEMMGDFGKGVKSFRQGLNDEDTAAARPRIEGPSNEAQPTVKPVSEVMPESRPVEPVDKKIG